MHVTIKAEPIKARELNPGDLFSTAGPEYWRFFGRLGSIGERVYIRTSAPASDASDADLTVYKITVQANDAQ